MTQPEGERIARLETQMQTLVTCQRRTSDALEKIDGKVDDIRINMSSNKASRAFGFKIASLCVGLSSGVATMIVFAATFV